MLADVIPAFIVASWIYWLVAFWLLRDFLSTEPEPDGSFMPPVSILKPVKGLDAQAYQNFLSFCHQEYPEYEVLFGVADPEDPVIPIIRRLQRESPDIAIRLIVAPPLGLNRKASLLHALAGQARHEYLVASDSDMCVTPDFLRRVIAPLADQRVGLVTCPYRGEMSSTLTARLEALYMGVTFLPSVIVARHVLQMRFALGAGLALRRSDLIRMGGFAAVADYLADDFQVGARIAALGLRVHLSTYIVSSVLGPTSFKEQWNREVRWARTNRVSRPVEYPGLLLSFSTAWSLVLLLVTGLAPIGFLALGISILLRWVVAEGITMYTGDQESRRWLFWLPMRDVLTALIWGFGAFGRQVTWRGEVFGLDPDGRLRALPGPAELPSSSGGVDRPS